MKRTLFLLFILFSVSLYIAADTHKADLHIIVEHYSVDQGLPNNIVNCSIKGKDGFMWFGTWYGLCSFDGAKFKAYNNRDGFYPDIPPRKIEKVVEDKNGFLWIKTIDRKLYVFDKHQERYHAVYDDVKDYSGNTQIIKIENTPEGDVLLLTKDKNLLRACTTENGEIKIQLLHDSSAEINIYDVKLKHNVFAETAGYINWIGMDFKIFSCPKGKELLNKPADFILRKLALSSSDSFTYAYNSADLIWLGNKKGELYHVNPQTGTVNKYTLPGITHPIRNILVTTSGIAYICVETQGVYEYNLGYKQLQKISVDLDTFQEINSFVDKYEKIWFVEDDHTLFYYDPLNKSCRRYPFITGVSIIPFETLDAGEQGLFFLTLSGEVLMFDRETLEMIRINQLKPFSDVQPNQLFFDLQLDEEGILWLSSTSTGVYKIYFPKKQFRLFKPQAFSTHSVTNEQIHGVRALFQAKNGDIWIGSRWADLYRFNSYGQFKQLFSAATTFVGNVYHIMEDHAGNLWLSTKGNGLVKAEPDILFPSAFRFVRYTNDINTRSSLSGNDAYFTYQDSKGRIWVGLFGGGLNLVWNEGSEITFKNKYNGFKQYPSYGLYMEVRNITEDHNGRIWVGTTDGLMSFDGNFNLPEEIVFETYRDEKASSNIADNDIYALYKDAGSQIWVSVFGGGLNKLIKYDSITHKPIFKTYGMREGLNTDVIVSIVEDDKQNLWLATESGLSRFNKETGRFRNYDKYDGFQGLAMEEGSAMRTQNGELWLGCREGVLTFNPEKLEVSDNEYKTYIVDFKISNKDLRTFKDKPVITESIKYTDALTLDYDQSMFTLEFAALNYANQNRVSYRYILEGYEKEWHDNGKNRIASYTNVPPGRYTFRVQSLDEANPDLLSARTLGITILPPWWKSGWAYGIYILSGIAFLVVAVRLIFLMMKMKNDVYIEQKLSELKIRFFTNISHELRTPLTLIKGPIQELKEKEKLSSKGLQYVDLMEKNTDQMLHLVNQILDFRKIQNGKMRLHVSLVNLNAVLKSFHEEFHVLAEENEINYSFYLPDEPIMLWADKERLEIVVRNIISNAFKFTPSGGSIFVSTGITDDDKKCFIRVEDSGIGIAQHKLTEIFERFSQAENIRVSHYQGTGIGLALSKEIVLLHHGTITVESQQQKGATFHIELLLGKEHYKPAEVDFYVSDNETIDELSQSSKKTKKEDRMEAEHADSSLPSLLVVEDNRDLINLIKLQLEDKFNIYTAGNGVEGLKKVHLYHPDLVVADQMMPEMDGIEMLRHIRNDFQISHIPVIILTAKNDDEAKTNAITVGANAYITKPFNKEYLVARIEQLLKERKLFCERVWHQEEHQEIDNYEQYLVKKDVQLLDKIHKVIEENMDNCEFNIDAIATNIGLSRSAFFKKLKSLTGLAPVDLVKEIRLNKSVELIKNTDLSISEIAYAVGFKDSGYYSKCFRKKYNQTPREYMSEWRKS